MTDTDTGTLHEIVKAIQHPFVTMHKIINTSTSLLVIAGSIFVGYGLFKSNEISKKGVEQIELNNKYYVIQNQQTILLKIIDENLRDSESAKLGSAPMEEKVALCKVMYDLSSIKRVPLSLLAGICNVESHWNTHAVSSANCVGILQVTPLYARSYLRENRIDYKKDIYFDPIVCCICSVSMLNDFQNEKIEKGLATPDNWMFSVHDYLWGPDKRGNIYDMNYSLKVIDSMKQYQKMGLL